MSDKVVQFTGATRLPIEPDRVIEAAKGELESVVVLGFDHEGNEYIASSESNGAELLWLIERCKHRLMRIVDEETE